MLKETMLSFTYKLSNQGSRIKTEDHFFLLSSELAQNPKTRQLAQLQLLPFFPLVYVAGRGCAVYLQGLCNEMNIIFDGL
jgi:hypothetical protein